jgi:Adenylate and Guanylate cyclase catalytic domain
LSVALAAARMESNGKRDCIHMSPETTNLLREAGKSAWCEPREDKINAKGKGEMQTYWLAVFANDHASTSHYSSNQSAGRGSLDELECMPEEKQLKRIERSKISRLVGWNTETLLKLLKEIVARRNCTLRNFFMKRSPNEEIYKHIEGKMVVDEIKEIITLPKFDRITAMNQQDISTIELDQEVVDQLQDYITAVASLYNDNPCKCRRVLLSYRYIDQVAQDA